MEDITFDDALTRLKEIAEIVQDKGMDIEKSLEYLEEGINLANFCTEKIDKTSWELDN
jgi:exodeoxyribonuclease VII small subunit